MRKPPHALGQRRLLRARLSHIVLGLIGFAFDRLARALQVFAGTFYGLAGRKGQKGDQNKCSVFHGSCLSVCVCLTNAGRAAEFPAQAEPGGCVRVSIAHCTEKGTAMPTETEITHKFWSALRSDMTVMLGLTGTESRTRPMTAQLHEDDEDDQGLHRGPIWFFTSTDATIAQNVATDSSAFFTFTSKGNDVFAHVTGTLRADNDRGMIDDLWNPFVAAWYDGGKDDPKLVLLRFEPANAEMWLDASNILAGLKVLFGGDPQREYADNVAKVAL